MTQSDRSKEWESEFKQEFIYQEDGEYRCAIYSKTDHLSVWEWWKLKLTKHDEEIIEFLEEGQDIEHRHYQEAIKDDMNSYASGYSCGKRDAFIETLAFLERGEA